MTKHEIELLSNNLGRALGTILPALHAFPPADQESAAVTAEAIQAVLDNSPGIPDDAKSFIEGVLVSLIHWVSISRPN